MQDSFLTCCIVAFGSRNSSRVGTGAFSEKELALAHALDIVIAMQHEYKNMLAMNLTLYLRTDSRALLHAISKNKAPREHRPEIYL
jgi:hypothetical protein